MNSIMEEQKMGNITFLRSVTSKMTFERYLNDQGAPKNFDFSKYNITKDFEITRVKRKFGRWLRYNHTPLFDKMYANWVKQKKKELKLDNKST